jgi:hypothetical protein
MPEEGEEPGSTTPPNTSGSEKIKNPKKTRPWIKSSASATVFKQARKKLQEDVDQLPEDTEEDMTKRINFVHQSALALAQMVSAGHLRALCTAARTVSSRSSLGDWTPTSSVEASREHLAFLVADLVVSLTVTFPAP